MSEREVGGSWRGILAVALWQVVASLCYYATFPATDSFQSAFGLTGFQVGLVVTSLVLGYTVFLFPAGAFVDAYGDRAGMVVGLAALSAGAVAVSLAQGYLALLAAVFAVGAAYSPAMPATNVAVTARAPAGRYNLAIGLKQVGVTAGSALAAFVVAVLAALALGWRLEFLLAAAAAAVVAVGFLLAYDGTGGSGEVTLPDVRGLGGHRPLVALVAAGFFVGAAIYTTTGYAVPYLQADTTATKAVAGGVLGLTQVTGSLGRIGTGALADRIRGTAAVSSLRVLCGTASFGALAVAAVPLLAMPVAVAGFAALGVGLLGVAGLYHGSLVALVDERESGAATAAGQGSLNLGGLVVPPAFGLVADTAGYATGWEVLAACVAAGVACALVSRRLAA